MHKNNMKLFIVPLIALSMFVLLLFGAGYAYYTSSSTMNTAYGNVTMPLRTTLSCVKKDASIVISYPNMYSNKAGSVVGSGTAYVNCTCSGAVGSSCNYNVSLVEIGAPYAPSPSIGTSKEFSVTVSQPSGCTAQNSSSTESQVTNLTEKIVSTCSLTIPSSGSITANVGAEFKWYNLNLSQDIHELKNYKYRLSSSEMLPSGYQQLEYITTDGSQYIDLNLSANQNYSFYVKFKTTDTITAGRGILGWYNGNQTNNYYLYVSSSKNWQFGYYNYENLGSVITTNTMYEVTNSKNILRINGTNYAHSTVSSLDTSPNKLWLWNLHASSSYTGLPLQAYAFKLYNGSTLVINMIPCKRLSDNVAGMYDLINGAFYPSSSSTAFTAGPTV